MQLKGASQQIGTIDEINAQTKKMAEQIDQLNKIYARMIEAMTVNMRAAAPRASEERTSIAMQGRALCPSPPRMARRAKSNINSNQVI